MNKSASLADDLTQIVLDLARRLWSVHTDDPAGPRLLMPSKRDESTRVSEQESKILFCQLLETTHWFYAVETPTAKTYVQSGSKQMSARNDISLYESRNTQSRIVNVELKAHNCTEENIRKDLEKLVREGIHGVWFHTLAAADRGTIDSLFNKFRRAFRGIADYLQGQTHFIIFAFCILETRTCFLALLELDGVPEKIFSRIDEMFDAGGLLGGSGRWRVYGNGKEDYQPQSSLVLNKQRTGADGSRDSEIIYSPELDHLTFLHLSIKGDSYRLRRFRRGRAEAFKAPGTKTLSEFKQRYAFQYQEATTAEDRKHNIDQDVAYWESRIQELNQRYAIT